MRVKPKNTRQIADRVKKRFAGYDIEVGVLQDGPHYSAKKGERGKKGRDVVSSYAGGPVRRKSRQSFLNISEVSKENRERLGFNYITQPFKDKSDDLIKFARAYFKMAASDKINPKRLNNLLQAIVRNPILRGDYGPNAPLTRVIKGFDRAMIDTGQLFKSLKGQVRKKGPK